MTKNVVRVSSVIFFLILSSACGLGKFSVAAPEEKPKLGQHNAVWTETLYLRGENPTTKAILTEKNIEDYANTLKKNNVKYSYLFAGPYEKNGHLPDYAFSKRAIDTVKSLKKYYPEIVILPWVGGVQNKTVYLGDPGWVKNALADTEKLIRVLKIPGVHIDFEYILAGDPYLDTTINKEKPGDLESYANNVNEFHRKLRRRLPKAFISSVVLATSPDTKPWKRKTTVDELKVLTKYVDQLSFLYYDTTLKDQKIFESNCASLVKDIQLLKESKNENKTQYLIAIGTFVNLKELHKFRDLEIESIPNTLQTIKKADPTGKIVDGIALFCDWQTDESEWKQFYQHWGMY